MLGLEVVSRARIPFDPSPSFLRPSAASACTTSTRARASPVVMLHGNPTWSFYYRNLVLALRDRYRCIVPDHIGCGLSDKPPADALRLLAEVAASTTSKRCSITSDVRENAHARPARLGRHDRHGLRGPAPGARSSGSSRRTPAAFPLAEGEAACRGRCGSAATRGSGRG